MTITAAFLLALIATLAALALARLVLRRLFTLPDLSGRARAPARGPAPGTKLMQAFTSGLAHHAGKTGVTPLVDAKEAFAYRLALVDTAEVSIDVQYYIWHGDLSGALLIDAIRRAAERGVQVRLLLDDNGITGLDPAIVALNDSPNIEIRIFNPSPLRRFKLLGFAIDFMRMNRRMHNKSLIVDGTAAIIGGRNIGDEYSQTSGDLFFLDLDVLVAGAVMPEISQMFASYWNCLSAFEAERIISGKGHAQHMQALMIEHMAQPAAQAFRQTASEIAQTLPARAQALEWTDVHLLADDPAKGLGIARRDQLMVTRLGSILGDVEKRLDLMSAYFVPGKPGRALFAGLAASGKTVNILTNAINTTDVLLVHSGYSKCRRALLKAGVTLFELKEQENPEQTADQMPPLGLSGASLHAKTFAVDDARVFIGSFNFDMRSAMLNCEMGVLIDSPSLARRMRETFDTQVAETAYRPALTPAGMMVWHEKRPDGTNRTHPGEPGATLKDRIILAVIGRLPVEWLL